MKTMEEDIYNIGAAVPGSIRLTAFTDTGSPIATGIYTNAQWYVGRNPLIDDASERAKLRVDKIVAEQYDSHGLAEVRWTLHYDAAGQLEEAYECRARNSASATSLQNILTQRFRWLQAPG